MDNKMMSVFGVCDGHGQFGHKASEFIRQVLPKKHRISNKFKPEWNS